MKSFFIFLILLLSTNICISQKPKSHHTYANKSFVEKPFVIGLNNQCLEELLNVCANNCMNGNQTLNAFALCKFNLEWGTSVRVAAQSFLNAKYNQWMLDKIFLLFYNPNKDWMINNFSQLGLRYDFSCQLTEFILTHIDEIKFRDKNFENASEFKNNEQQKEKNEENSSYELIDEMPRFHGGEDAMFKFIADNLKYPVKSIQEGIEGKVTLKFLVYKTGEVIKVDIIHSLDSLCDNEAIRVVKAFPIFTPAKSHGRNVSVWYTLPITFKLQK